MVNQLFILLFLLCFVFACKKEVSDTNLGTLDIADAKCLLLNTVGSSKVNYPSDTVKLYKLTISDDVQTVKFLTKDGSELVDKFVTDGIYHLNSSYFLLNLYQNANYGNNIETYLVNKNDGSVTKFAIGISPQYFTESGWTKGYKPEGFFSPDSNTFYIPNNNIITRLKIQSDGSYSLRNFNINTHRFIADSAGNIIYDNQIFYAGNFQTQFSEAGTNDYLVNKTTSGFYKLSAINDSVGIDRIDIENQNYWVTHVQKLPVNLELNKYLGSAYIPGLQGSCFVFDKAIVYIDANNCHLISFSYLSLLTVTNFYITDNLLFINGLNVLNKEIFIRLNPKSKPTIFSDNIAPDEYNYKCIQVCQDGSWSFFAKKVYSAGEVFGYRSAKQMVSILDNEFGFNNKQVLTIK